MFVFGRFVVLVFVVEFGRFVGVEVFLSVLMLKLVVIVLLGLIVLLGEVVFGLVCSMMCSWLFLLSVFRMKFVGVVIGVKVERF